ncbi:CotH kinase family protein [Stieleria sp. JC731]|uniref:CotH kinase family protein n=1 Tax=Pirellulaceae TaxID=2691357 RepID=UPI0039656E99
MTAFLGLGTTFVSAQPPGMGGGDREILDQFDTDESGWLNQSERKEAREWLKDNPPERRGFGGPPGGPPGARGGFPGPGFGPPPGAEPGGQNFGPPQGFGPPDTEGRERHPGPGGFGPGGFGRRGAGPGGPFGGRPEATEGVQVAKDSVQPQTGGLYDLSTFRTLFIDFENADWESELEDFHGTDVDVPAMLTVDGKTFEGVGIHFRGMSSYGMVPTGYKRSFNLSIDMVDEDQRLLGYKTLNLLNSSSDDSMLSTVLYSQIANKYIAAPKANFVRVVINGENWGVYTNVQQFNKDFLRENYSSDKGARWKVSGSPAGGGGLDYRGDDPSSYQHPYEQKSGGKKSLAKLIDLCRVLDETSTEQLPAKLEKICDVDGLLWFLAIDNALINSDGYWIRASDYSIYLDGKDKFHFIPHDMNEAFRGAGGPGMPGGPGMRGGAGMQGGRPRFAGRPPFESNDADGRPFDRSGRADRGFGPSERGSQGGAPRGPSAGQSGSSSPIELDPLIGLDDLRKPLRSKVLAVPKYREQYLRNVKTIAEEDLDWKNLGSLVSKCVDIIGPHVETDTRKLGSYEAFVAATSAKNNTDEKQATEHRGHGAMNLKAFADGRRDYLLRVIK